MNLNLGWALTIMVMVKAPKFGVRKTSALDSSTLKFLISFKMQILSVFKYTHYPRVDNNLITKQKNKRKSISYLMHLKEI